MARTATVTRNTRETQITLTIDLVGPAGAVQVITCLLSAIGVKVGAMFGDKYRAPAERIGGIVLILIGVKTLLTGLGVL